MSSFCATSFSSGRCISAIHRNEGFVEIAKTDGSTEFCIIQRIPTKGEVFMIWSVNSLHLAVINNSILAVNVYADISEEGEFPNWILQQQIKLEEALSMDQVSFSFPHLLLHRNKECILVNIVNSITQLIPIPISVDVEAEDPSVSQIQKQMEAIKCSPFLNKLSHSGRYISTVQNSPSVPMGKIVRIYDTVDVLTATLDKSVPVTSCILLNNVDDDHFDFKYVDINLEKSNPAVCIKWRPTSQTHVTINNTSNSNNSNVVGDNFSHTEHFLMQQLNGDTKIYSIHTDTMPDDDGIVAQALSAAVAAGVVNANENEYLNNHSTAENYILKITESAPIVRLLIELPYSFLYSHVTNPSKKSTTTSDDTAAVVVDDLDGLIESNNPDTVELKPATLDVHIDWVVHALQSSVEFNLRNANTTATPALEVKSSEGGNTTPVRSAKPQDSETSFQAAWLTIVLPIHPAAAVWEEQGVRKRYNNVNKVLEYYSVPKSKTLRSRSRSFSTASSNSLSSANVTRYEAAQCSFYSLNTFYLRHDPKNGNYSVKLCNEGYSFSLSASSPYCGLLSMHTVAKFPSSGVGFPLSLVSHASLTSSDGSWAAGLVLNKIHSAVQVLHSGNYLKISPQSSDNAILSRKDKSEESLCVVTQARRIPMEVQCLPVVGSSFCHLLKEHGNKLISNGSLNLSRLTLVDLLGVSASNSSIPDCKVKIIRAVSVNLPAEQQQHLLGPGSALSHPSDTECLVVLYSKQSPLDANEVFCLGLWSRHHHDLSSSLSNQLQAHYHSPSVTNTPMQVERKSSLRKQTSKIVVVSDAIYTVDIVPDSHFGLGLRLDIHPVDNKSIVVNSFKRHPLTNEPMAAEQKGLITPGDEIVRINEQTLHGHSLPEVIGIIKGVLTGCGTNQHITLTMRKLSGDVSSSSVTASGESKAVVNGTPEKEKAEKAMRTHKSNVVHVAEQFNPVIELVLSGAVTADLSMVGDVLTVHTVENQSDHCELKRQVVKVRLSNKILGLVKIKLIDEGTSVTISDSTVNSTCRLQLWPKDSSEGAKKEIVRASVLVHEPDQGLIVLLIEDGLAQSVKVKKCDPLTSALLLTCPFETSEWILSGAGARFKLLVNLTSPLKEKIGHVFQGSLTKITESDEGNSEGFAVQPFNAMKSHYDAMVDTTTGMSSVSQHELVKNFSLSTAIQSFNAAEELLTPIHPLEILIHLFDPLQDLISERKHGFGSASTVSSLQLNEALAGLLALVDESTDSLNGDQMSALQENKRENSELARLATFLWRKLQPYLEGSMSGLEAASSVIHCNGMTLSPQLASLLYVTAQMVLTVIRLSSQTSEVTGDNSSVSVTMGLSEEAELSNEVKTIHRFLNKLGLDFYGIKAVLQMLFQRTLNDFVNCAQVNASAGGEAGANGGRSSRSVTASVVSDASTNSLKYSQPIKLTGMDNTELTDSLTAKYEFLGETLKDITGSNSVSGVAPGGEKNADKSSAPESTQDAFRVSGSVAASLFFSASQSQLCRILIDSAHEDVKALHDDVVVEKAKGGEAAVLGKYLTAVSAGDQAANKAMQMNERRNRSDFNFAGLVGNASEAGDILKFLSESLVGFWLHDCSVLSEVIQKQAMKQFKVHKSSIQVFLEMVLIGRLDTLTMLAKTDREKSGKQLLSILNVYNDVDTESSEEDVAQCNKVLKKNAFALLKLQRYKDAAAVFLMARPPFIKEACSVLNNQHSNPLLALLATRIVETRLRFTGSGKPSGAMLGPIARRLLAHDLIPALKDRLESLQSHQAVTHSGGADAPVAALYSDITAVDARMLILVCSFWLQNKSTVTQAFLKTHCGEAVLPTFDGNSGTTELAKKKRSLKSVGIDTAQLYDTVTGMSSITWLLECGHFIGPSACSDVIRSYQRVLTEHHLHHRVLEMSRLTSEGSKHKLQHLLTRNGFHVASSVLRERAKSFVPDSVSVKSTAAPASVFVEAPVDPSTAVAPSVVQSTPMKSSLFNFNSTSKAAATITRTTSSSSTATAAGGSLSMLDDFSPPPVRRIPSAGQQASALDMFDAVSTRAAVKSTSSTAVVGSSGGEPRSALDMFDAPSRSLRGVLNTSSTGGGSQGGATEPRSALDMFDVPSRPVKTTAEPVPAAQVEQRSALDAFDIPQRPSKAKDTASVQPATEKAKSEPRSALDMFDIPSRASQSSSTAAESHTEVKHHPTPEAAGVKSALDMFDAPSRPVKAAESTSAPVAAVSQPRSALDSFDIPTRPLKTNTSVAPQPSSQQQPAVKSALDMFDSVPSRPTTRTAPPFNPLAHNSGSTGQSVGDHGASGTGSAATKAKDLKGTLDFLDKLPKVSSTHNVHHKPVETEHKSTSATAGSGVNEGAHHGAAEKQKPQNPFLKKDGKASGSGAVPTKPDLGTLHVSTDKIQGTSAASSVIVATEPNTGGSSDSDLIDAIGKELDEMDLK